MDSVLTDSLTVLCDSGLSDPRLFFASVGEVHEELDQAGAGGDFDAFRSALADRAGRDGFAEAGARFTRYLEANGGTEIVRKLAEESVDDLVAEYERVLAETGDSAEPAAPGGGAYDESVWTAFVAEYGASWNGEAETWDAFRTWFLYHAEERGVAAPATDFLDYAEGETDRVAFFARYGVVVEGAAEVATDAAADAAAEDPGAWEAFLAAYGPDWNGAEENWASFTPYFLHYAEERGVPGFAAAFLENAPDDNDERVRYFASYGISVGEEAGDDAPAGNGEPVTAAEIAEAEQQFAQVADESDHVPEEHEEAITEAFAELVNQMPEAANLTREQMRELLATIPPEHL
ncbi:hypothetical protein [Actinophytocola algeriensis]|uniref:Uncharacterized protein n=1 Tax=Actinophytocola algeriensis TaxID=1768010 RepID=A0A7W7Q4V5_9PSEU|nr:hypothetical protein [Actinophytocola algeriensis]MBB4907029.1 hypothetical protein [Actinophytocola algeriensis]MBE1478512.1 hypothetical protein [Actinophytocola algeriensis]